MRLLAIGDIHGCLRAFTTLLDLVALQPDDQIITLGDYVDRGPDSRGVLDRLVALYDTGQLSPLRGNHDVMMLGAREIPDPFWLGFGGAATLLSYGKTREEIDEVLAHQWTFDTLLEAVPPRHWQFLAHDCRRYYESEHHFFVHGWADPHLPLDEQSDDTLYWEKLNEPSQHMSGKVMVCGHTRQKSGEPLDLGSTICIDTNVYEGGWLTCLEVQTGRLWQANEKGQTRKGWLDQGAKWMK
jgi:serine/threonine protein phosphatase 1